MSNTLCDRFNVLAYPLIPMIIASQLKVVTDSTLILYYVIFLTIAHLHYGFCVVSVQICFFRSHFAVKTGLLNHIHTGPFVTPDLVLFCFENYNCIMNETW